MSLAAISPCTSAGNKTVSHIGYLLLIVVSISLIAAPVGDVTIPILFGILLIFFFLSLSNKPSLDNFFFNCSKATYNAPIPSSSISSTYI